MRQRARPVPTTAQMFFLQWNRAWCVERHVSIGQPPRRDGDKLSLLCPTGDGTLFEPQAGHCQGAIYRVGQGQDRCTPNSHGASSSRPKRQLVPSSSRAHGHGARPRAASASRIGVVEWQIGTAQLLIASTQRRIAAIQRLIATTQRLISAKQQRIATRQRLMAKSPASPGPSATSDTVRP